MRDASATSKTFIEEAKRIAWRRTAPVDALVQLYQRVKGKEALVGPAKEAPKTP